MNPERIAYGNDASQFFDLWSPNGPVRGDAVMIHGGFWRSRYDLTNANPLCAGLAGEGYRVASLEYRRVGPTGGGWPVTFDDVVSGFHAALKILGTPVVAGHSAGGHLALRLAVETDRMSGVVALAPAAVLELGFRLHLGNGATEEFMGGSPAALPDAYKAACPSVHPSNVRRILVHGNADDVVPLELSQAFLEARGTDRGTVELVEIDGADHMALIDPAAPCWQTVVEAFDSLRG